MQTVRGTGGSRMSCTGCSPSCCCWARRPPRRRSRRSIAPTHRISAVIDGDVHPSAVADQDRRQLHDPELPGGRTLDQLQLRRSRADGDVADHLRQRRATPARCRATPVHDHKIWFTNGSSTASMRTARTCSSRSRRSTRQIRGRRRPRSACRSPTAHDPGPVRPGRAPSSTTRVAQRPARHHVTDDLNATGAISPT